MPDLLLINGPNLGRLGHRSPGIYGTTTLAEIEMVLRRDAALSGLTVHSFQSDVEGEIIRFIDAHRSASALIINPGALMISGWCLRDCLEDFAGYKIEVHISNIFSRERFRHHSILADVMNAFMSGFGTNVYRLALKAVEYAIASGDSAAP
jgi:5-deoxy-5-amino-3-dehydroquinate dehydratase